MGCGDAHGPRLTVYTMPGGCMQGDHKKKRNGEAYGRRTPREYPWYTRGWMGGSGQLTASDDGETCRRWDREHHEQGGDAARGHKHQ